MSRTYGQLKRWTENIQLHKRKVWGLAAEPHIMLRAKRVFERMNKKPGEWATLSDTPENCRDLLWFIDRYPLEILPADLRALKRGAKAFDERILTMERIIGGHTPPQRSKMKLPPREYQRLASELHLTNGSLLVADDVGLGKTVTAICSLTDSRTLPALIVTLGGAMPAQWAAEIERFAPWLHVHVLKTSRPYELPTRGGVKPDVIVCNYHKLYGWSQVLARYCRSVTYDEAQELRREGSDKYRGARHISQSVAYRLGLTATPIYNYGSEMFNVMECVSPGLLGSRVEFAREWCKGDTDDRAKLCDARAFGSYLRETFAMIRRTRADVGRELPALTKVPHAIDSNRRELERIEGRAGELARIILAGHGAPAMKMQAAEELTAVVRQATGIAKAPFVAEFVRMIIENGESVVLYGWHRAVYELWSEALKDLNPAWYTGEESTTQKTEARRRFVAGETKLLIMSLRAGAGLDGLQGVCSTAVFGELDWSPGVHEQCIGRVHRDGQAAPVFAYFLISDEGCDQIMAEVLGLKGEQVDGIRSPNRSTLERLETAGDHVKRLAERYVRRSVTVGAES